MWILPLLLVAVTAPAPQPARLSSLRVLGDDVKFNDGSAVGAHLQLEAKDAIFLVR